LKSVLWAFRLFRLQEVVFAKGLKKNSFNSASKVAPLAEVRKTTPLKQSYIKQNGLEVMVRENSRRDYSM
jgi:hypothetical protein